MTKKDYVKAAKIVVDMKDSPDYHWGSAMYGFIELFQSDNPNFDETKFREACKGK